MTHGESIRELLAAGPLSKTDLLAQMETRGVAPVITNTVLIGMEFRKVIVVRDGMVELADGEAGR